MKCNCFKCPLGKDQYERYKLSEDDHSYDEEIAYNIWCDKTGSKCGWYGYCDEAFDKEKITQSKTNKKKSNKYTRRKKHSKRLKYLERISNYPTPVMYINEKWDKELMQYIPVDKPYYKRLYRNNHKGGRHKFYKKYANQVVRRYRIGTYDIHEDADRMFPDNKTDRQLRNGGSYKKIFDYWWTVD